VETSIFQTISLLAALCLVAHLVANELQINFHRMNVLSLHHNGQSEFPVALPSWLPRTTFILLL
jgi:hypothetical protein